MKKYITSDKVGEFCQAMSEAGVNVSVDGESLSVRHCDGSYTFIDIYQKNSFENLVSEILGTETSLRAQGLSGEGYTVRD